MKGRYHYSLNYKMEQPISTSPKFSLNSTDLYKAFRGLCILLASTIITYIAQTYTQFSYAFTYQNHYYDFTPLVVAVLGFLIELARRFLTNYQSTNE